VAGATQFASSGINGAFSRAITPLQVGANVIRVYGTNLLGQFTSDTITITRSMSAGIDTPRIALSNDNQRTIISWSNAPTATIWAQTNQYYSGSGPWFALATSVASPYVHQAASNYWAVFYRVVNGLATGAYDVGKMTLQLAAGNGTFKAYNWIATPFEPFSNTVDYVLGDQLNYEAADHFDILQAQSAIGVEQLIDTYYFAGTWTDFGGEAVRIRPGVGYILVIDQTHTTPRAVTLVGKVPTAAVTNTITAGTGTFKAYNWIGAATPAARILFANGVTNPVVTTESSGYFDIYQEQTVMGIDSVRDWYYYNGVWDDFAGGISTQVPSKMGILILDQTHTGAETNWITPATK
jgi:hypothetical protein